MHTSTNWDNRELSGVYLLGETSITFLILRTSPFLWPSKISWFQNGTHFIDFLYCIVFLKFTIFYLSTYYKLVWKISSNFLLSSFSLQSLWLSSSKKKQPMNIVGSPRSTLLKNSSKTLKWFHPSYVPSSHLRPSSWSWLSIQKLVSLTMVLG